MFRVKLFRIVFSILFSALLLGQSLSAFAKRPPEKLKLESTEIKTSVIDTSKNRLIIDAPTELDPMVIIKPARETLTNGRAVKIEGTIDENGKLVVDLTKLGSAHLVPSGKYLILAKQGKKVLQGEFKILSPRLVIGKLQVPVSSIPNYDPTKPDYKVSLNFQLYDLKNNPIGPPTQVSGRIEDDSIKGTLLAEVDSLKVVQTKTQVLVDRTEVGVWRSIAGPKKARNKSRADIAGTSLSQASQSSTEKSTVTRISNSSDLATDVFLSANQHITLVASNKLNINTTNSEKVASSLHNTLYAGTEEALTAADLIPTHRTRDLKESILSERVNSIGLAYSDALHQSPSTKNETREAVAAPSTNLGQLIGSPTTTGTASSLPASTGDTSETNRDNTTAALAADFSTKVPSVRSDKPINEAPPSEPAVARLDSSQIGLSPDSKPVRDIYKNSNNTLPGSVNEADSETLTKNLTDGTPPIGTFNPAQAATTLQGINKNESSNNLPLSKDVNVPPGSTANLNDIKQEFGSKGASDIKVNLSPSTIVGGDKKALDGGTISKVTAEGGSVISGDVATSGKVTSPQTKIDHTGISGIPPAGDQAGIVSANFAALADQKVQNPVVVASTTTNSSSNVSAKSLKDNVLVIPPETKNQQTGSGSTPSSTSGIPGGFKSVDSNSLAEFDFNNPNISKDALQNNAGTLTKIATSSSSSTNTSNTSSTGGVSSNLKILGDIAQDAQPTFQTEPGAKTVSVNDDTVKTATSPTATTAFSGGTSPKTTTGTDSAGISTPPSTSGSTTSSGGGTSTTKTPSGGSTAQQQPPSGSSSTSAGGPGLSLPAAL